MTIKPPARGYWLAIPEHIQVLIADSFRSINFAAPFNQPINRTIPPSTRWVPAPHPPTKKGFAEGSEGLVNLWCLLDGDQRITDRIIVKQVHPGATRYNDPLNWKDGAVGGEPRECAMANAVWSALPVAHRKHVLECLGWGDCKGEPRWKYRLYFEYSAHGDLSTIIRGQKGDSVRAGRKRKADDDDILLPEPFIWYLLESLAIAVLAMDNAGDQQGIVHGTPDTGALYPIPKVADFGSSRNIGDPGVKVRGDVVRRDACCMLFAPPELAKVNDGVAWEVKGGPNTLLSNKTNVWQVGMLIACCMRLSTYLPETNWRDMDRSQWETTEVEQLRFRGPKGRRELKRKRLSHENSDYSIPLIGITQKCLKFDPAERPTPQALLDLVRKYMRVPVAGGADELRIRLDDHHGIGKEY
ncbi:hypothetical protein E4T50_02211 [Aureobasidium sp. EXF-12298]|nr:hypothetical protein E4T50_02211 [Aureobasidium sp. EXF-12298]